MSHRSRQAYVAWNLDAGMQSTEITISGARQELQVRSCMAGDVHFPDASFSTVNEVREPDALTYKMRSLHARVELSLYCTIDLLLSLGHQSTVAQVTTA